MLRAGWLGWLRRLSALSALLRVTPLLLSSWLAQVLRLRR
jgi:hypothetical protein